ncbi:MAG: TraR/DksA family transcriptional regulator [Nitrospira sp.]|nr:TraR/DksA family transcriptional regulator [Nitrospira sp.]
MLRVDEIRKKLITQRRELFREVAKTEEDLRWLQSDIESEVEERGQEETMVRLLDRLDGRAKAEIEAIDRALFKLGAEQYGRCERCGKAIPQSRLEAVPGREDRQPYSGNRRLPGRVRGAGLSDLWGRAAGRAGGCLHAHCQGADPRAGFDRSSRLGGRGRRVAHPRSSRSCARGDR